VSLTGLFVVGVVILVVFGLPVMLLRLGVSVATVVFRARNRAAHERESQEQE
jgi:Sec-independent protein translocase protein TatA